MKSGVKIGVGFAVLVSAACSGKDTPKPSASVQITHGTAATEVTATRATIWARAAADSTITVNLWKQGDAAVRSSTVVVTSETDFAGAVSFDELSPNTRYAYRAFAGVQDYPYDGVAGEFQTAPQPSDEAAVTFAWSGDLAGQNVCRDSKRGFPILEHMNAAAPVFFVALGDMIYADNACEAVGTYGNAQVVGDFGPSATIGSFWAHWRYNREDRGLVELYRSMATYAIWDDHEVVNDFGPHHDSRSQPPYRAGEKLMPTGLRAFLDYNPIAEPGGPLYRSVRWGKHVELLLLDNRSYRDANSALDNGERAKTMLGQEQLTWLTSRLRESDATWKVVASSVPISIPTGSGPPNVARDGWADFGSGQGFERELNQILEAAASASANTLWITTDVHFASVFRYRPKLTAGPYVFHEVVVGPMSAGLFPSKDFDDSFAPERLFFHGPERPERLTYEEALSYMSFGLASVAADGSLGLKIIDGTGKEIFRLNLPGH